MALAAATYIFQQPAPIVHHCPSLSIILHLSPILFCNSPFYIHQIPVSTALGTPASSGTGQTPVLPVPRPGAWIPKGMAVPPVLHTVYVSVRPDVK